MPRVKTFFRGGIEVDSYRSLTGAQPILSLFIPSLAVIPLVQYPGAKAEWVIETGDLVAEDQILARESAAGHLPLHSPIPGRVLEFREVTLPWGASTTAALIRLEGEFSRTGRTLVKKSWALSPDKEIFERIRSAGIFLESSPLDPRRSLHGLPATVETLVVNGLQPEPYLTLSQNLMRHRAQELAEGVRIVQKLLRPAQTHFVSDPDHPEEWLQSFSSLLDGVVLHPLQFKYPQAQEGLLLKTLGIDFERGKADQVLILDVASILAIRDAVVEARAQVEKDVVVSGHGVRRPGVYRVKVGTPLFQLLKDAGGLRAGDHKVLVGGPFQGQAVDALSMPVLKSTQAVLVLEKREVNEETERPCIRCGLCVESCPVGLEPLNLHKALVQGDIGLARSEGLGLCIECGICSYICPSRVPLAAQFHQAKGGTDGS